MNATFGADLVSDDATKIEILKAAFPNSRVSVSKQTPLDWKPFPWPGHELTDALTGEEEYDVTGLPDKFEEPSADVFLAGTPSKSRRVRFRVCEVKSQSSESTTYVALAHYTFTGKEQKSICCEWFTRLFVLSRLPTGWTADHTDRSLTGESEDSHLVPPC
jgi:hypothetical protein